MKKNRVKKEVAIRKNARWMWIGYLLIMALTLSCIGWQGKSFYLKATRLKSLDQDPIPSPMHPFDPRGFRGTSIWEVVRLVYLYDVDALDEMLSQKKYNLNEASSSGFTVLSLAIILPREEMIHILLKNGANPNQTSKADDSSSMHYASVRDPAILKVLLEHGGNPNVPKFEDESSKNKWSPPDTPLSLAAGRGLEKNVQLLLNAGGEVNYGNGIAVKNSMTQDHLNITLILLQNGFDLKTELSKPSHIKWTIENELQLNEKNKNTPRFSERDFNKIVQFLKEKGIVYQHVEPRK